MQAEHLCKWLREAMREVGPDDTHWRKVEVMVQPAFRYGTFAKEGTCKTVVMILKG